MAISTTGRVVKIKRKSELKRVGGSSSNADAMTYNHLRIHFTDGSDRHFLFTDAQIERASSLAKAKLSDDPKTTWVREVWYEGVMELDEDDVEKAIQQNGLPKIAKRLNHVRIEVGGEEVRLLFKDSTIRSAMNRAKSKGGRLPKVSWLSDAFFKETKNVEVESQGAGESQQNVEPSEEPEPRCIFEQVGS